MIQVSFGFLLFVTVLAITKGQKYGSGKQQWFYNQSTRKLVPLQAKTQNVDLTNTQFQQRNTVEQTQFQPRIAEQTQTQFQPRNTEQTQTQFQPRNTEQTQTQFQPRNTVEQTQFQPRIAEQTQTQFQQRLIETQPRNSDQRSQIEFVKFQLPASVNQPRLIKNVDKENQILDMILPKSSLTQPIVKKEDFCRDRMPEERIPYPGDSNKFIVCHAGGLFDIMSCPKSLVFSPKTTHCENSLREPLGCLASPCRNNGICVDLPFLQFRCDCQEGFSGRLCQKQDTCSKASCGLNGECIQLANGSPINHFCMCDSGLTYGLACGPLVEPNPCLSNDADLHSFPSTHNPSIFVQCEGHIPHIKFCSHPLVYSHVKQECDWAQQ